MLLKFIRRYRRNLCVENEAIPYYMRSTFELNKAYPDPVKMGAIIQGQNARGYAKHVIDFKYRPTMPNAGKHVVGGLSHVDRITLKLIRNNRLKRGLPEYIVKKNALYSDEEEELEGDENQPRIK